MSSDFKDSFFGVKDHVDYPQVIEEKDEYILTKDNSKITIKNCDVEYAKDISGDVYIGKFYSKAKKPEDVVSVFARIHSKEVYDQFLKNGGEAEIYREC